jgi:hypothetical protein
MGFPAGKLVKKKRQPRIMGDIAYIPLTRGFEAVIELVDLPLVSRHNWHAMPVGQTVYAVRKEYGSGKQQAVLMHRVVTGAADGSDVDHRDRDGLNNRRANLRVCSRSENMRNQPTPRHNSSGAKGVSWVAGRNKWLAQIKVNGRQVNLGRFDTLEAAQAAYADGAAKYHGEFARTA